MGASTPSPSSSASVRGSVFGPACWRLGLALCLALALAMVARPGAAAGLAVPPATPGPGVAFATFPIPLHVESVRQGLFITLIQEAAQLARLPHPHIEVMSPMRAVRSLQLGTHDALFPALDVYFESAQAIVRTRESIDCKEDFVFTRKGTPLLRSVADLRGRRVGITRGYPYAREVTHSPAFEREEAPSDELNIRKLVAGRIDAFVVDAKTGLKAAEALGLRDDLQHDPALPLSRQDVYVAFRATPSGVDWSRRMSAALLQLKASGRYRAITQGLTFAQGCGRR